MSLTSPTGSLINNLVANFAQPTPEAGMGATRLSYTDRRAYTVVRVVGLKTVEVRADKATRTDANGLSEVQAYAYEADADAPLETVTLRRNGRWVLKGESALHGTAFVLGYRQAYCDPSF